MDREVWDKLTEDEKFNELNSWLEEFIRLDSGEHPLRNTYQAGKIKTLKTELKQKINQIINWEYIK